MENIITKWIKDRLAERTSWDGSIMIAAGIAMILVPVDLIAYGLIGYGAWTLIKKEK